MGSDAAAAGDVEEGETATVAYGFEIARFRWLLDRGGSGEFELEGLEPGLHFSFRNLHIGIPKPWEGKREK